MAPKSYAAMAVVLAALVAGCGGGNPGTPGTTTPDDPPEHDAAMAPRKLDARPAPRADAAGPDAEAPADTGVLADTAVPADAAAPADAVARVDGAHAPGCAPDGGAGSPAGPGAVTALAKLATCATAPALPATSDVDAFTVAPWVKRGSLLPPVAPAPGRLAVAPPFEPDEFVLPACAHPVRFEQTIPAAAKVDGLLDEWQGRTPAVVDAAGDGVDLDAGARLDLVRVHHGRDATNHHFAFVAKEDWPGPGTHFELWLSIQPFGLPGPMGGPAVTVGAVRGVRLVRITEAGVYLDDPGRPTTALPPARYELATRGRVLELRLPSAELDGAARLPNYALAVYARRTTAAGAPAGPMDQTASLVVGPPADYACLVELPGQRWKLFVLRRDPQIQACEAELNYRAAVQAPSYVEQETGEAYDSFDTVTITLVQSGAALHWGALGIWLRDTYDDGNLRPPPQLFQVAAHEYAHGLNTYDWRLPKSWLREGHSEHSSDLALRRAFGASVAQARFQGVLHHVLNEEAAAIAMGMVRSLEDWNPAPCVALDQAAYNKAELFMHALATLLPYRQLSTVLRRYAAGGAEYRDGPAVLAELTRQPGFTRPVTPTMWNGWFGKSYDGAVVLPAELATDSDYDGVFNFQEAALGLATEMPDSDGDGRGDLFELSAPSDPLTADPPLTGLAADNLLGDWDTLSPNGFALGEQITSMDAACAGNPHITRAAARYDGAWLVIAVELSKRNGEPTLSITTQWTEAGGAKLRVDALQPVRGDPSAPVVDTLALFQITGDKSMLRGWGTQLAPLYGGQRFEFAVPRAWLGWGATAPPGLKMSVYTNTGPAGRRTGCGLSHEFALLTPAP